MGAIRRRRGRYFLGFYDQHGQCQRVMLPEDITMKAARDELRNKKDLVKQGVFLRQ